VSTCSAKINRELSAPLAKNGELELHIPDSNPVKVRIKQIQLEQVCHKHYNIVSYFKDSRSKQDTAKSTFNPRKHLSYINLNRAGTGLMEIVSEPDLRFVALLISKILLTALPRSPEEAGAYVRALQAVLRAMRSSDGNMEQVKIRKMTSIAFYK